LVYGNAHGKENYVEESVNEKGIAQQGNTFFPQFLITRVLLDINYPP